MAATTTQTIRLLDCPACKEHVIAELTYGVKLNERVRGEGEAVDPIDATATATLTLTGVRIQHECPKLTLHRGGGSPAIFAATAQHHRPPVPQAERTDPMTDHRSAITGKFVTADPDAANLDTTVSEARDQPEPIVRTVGDLTARHVGKRVRVEGCVYTLDHIGASKCLFILGYGGYFPGQQFPLDTPCEVLS